MARFVRCARLIVWACASLRIAEAAFASCEAAAPSVLLVSHIQQTVCLAALPQKPELCQQLAFPDLKLMSSVKCVQYH